MIVCYVPEAASVWPTPCPKCGAGVGEPCLTLLNRRITRHKARIAEQARRGIGSSDIPIPGDRGAL